jgi:Tfp pilus assembly protein PilV
MTMRNPRRPRRAAGYTLVEVLIASIISALVAIGAVSLTTMTRRMEKSIFSQQRELSDAKKAIETIDREIRMATTPLTVVDAGGAATTQGNRVIFARNGEAAGHRAFELKSVDGAMTTPGDNTLVYDPDTGVSGNEIVLARMISTTDGAGAFRYLGATSPLQVFLRVGDPTIGTGQAGANAITGTGWEGLELNISVGPRN